MDYNIIQLIVEKLQTGSYKAGETILQENVPDDLQLIVLEGSVAKFKGNQMVMRYEKNKVIADEVIGQSVSTLKYRNYKAVANTDCKVISCSKQSFNMVMSVQKMDKERVV